MILKNIYLLFLVGLFGIPSHLFSQTYTLAGTITRHNGDPVEGVEVALFGATSITGPDGNYALTNVPIGSFSFTPTGVFEKFEDITVLDALVLRQKILNTINLNLWQDLESDVNHSNSLTTLDMVQLIRLALHQDDGGLPMYEFCFDDGIIGCPAVAFVSNQTPDTVIIRNFKAIKRADLAISTDYMPAPAEAPSPVLFISKENFQVGEEVSFEVTVEDFENILGIQQTFEWDTNLLEFQSISGHNDYIPNTNQQEISSGKLPTMSFVEVSSFIELSDGEVLYTLTFIALSNSPPGGYALAISDELTPPQMVWQKPADNELFILEGSYVNGENPTAIASFFENVKFEIFPNPTQEFLKTQIELEKSENFELKIVNSLGQNVYSRDFNEQILNLDIHVKDFPNGIYFMILQSGEALVTKSFLKK